MAEVLSAFFKQWFYDGFLKKAQQFFAVGLFLFLPQVMAQDSSLSEKTSTLAESVRPVPQTEEAAKVATKVQPSDYFLQILLSLILILLIIFLSAWLLKRYAHINGALNGQIKVLGGLSLGQREKVVLLQVGEAQILVGVTTTQITTLHTLAKPIEVESSEMEARPFSRKLQGAMQNLQVKQSQQTSKNHFSQPQQENS